MKKDPQTTTPNVKNRINPFWDMTRMMVPERNYAGIPDPDPQGRTVRQSRVQPGSAGFVRNNPFLPGMDKALEQDRMANKYKRSQRPPRDTSNEYTPDDAWTTRKSPRVAGATKTARPTPGDAMDNIRKKGLNPQGYFSPEMQKMIELDRRRQIEDATAFEKGLDLAKTMGRKKK